MKFTVNTESLQSALELGVINANVSNFHKKSCMIQFSADSSNLTVNVEAARIQTELTIPGTSEFDDNESYGERVTVFVQALVAKQLISTFDSDKTTLEFVKNGLILHSGKSTFNLPKMIEASDIELDRPYLGDIEGAIISLDKENWKFIKDRQMYALAMSFVHPVYTRVWVGDGGDVLVGDFDSSLFTHSRKGNLGRTCLLSDTIINLLVSLPESTTIAEHDSSYVLRYDSDKFTYVSQITPQYESDESVGSYNSDIFLTMMDHPDTGIALDVVKMTKYLNQATLLASSVEDTITMAVTGSTLTLKDKNVDCVIDMGSSSHVEFSVEFKMESLRKVISNYTGNVSMVPATQDGEVVGILLWDDSLTTILAGVED